MGTHKLPCLGVITHIYRAKKTFILYGFGCPRVAYTWIYCQLSGQVDRFISPPKSGVLSFQRYTVTVPLPRPSDVGGEGGHLKDAKFTTERI